MSDALAPVAAPLRAAANSIFRHAITAAGTALVAHGLVDQGAVNDAVPPLAEMLTGGALALASAAWAGGRSWFSHTRWAAAWAALRARP